MAMVVPTHMNMWRQRMSTDRDILTLAQWLSPSYPVGAFAYSHGLEAAIQSGAITSGEDLEHWLADIVRHGSGRNDCILLRAAYAPDAAALGGDGVVVRVQDGEVNLLVQGGLQVHVPLHLEGGGEVEVAPIERGGAGDVFGLQDRIILREFHGLRLSSINIHCVCKYDP